MSERRTIRLPRTSESRSAFDYLKLLCRVDRRLSTGWDFQGKFLRPGVQISRDELWPKPDYPATPLLLEAAHVIGGPVGRGRRRNPSVYILWRFEQGSDTWGEVSRSMSPGIGWIEDIGPIASRILSGDERYVRISPREVYERIVDLLDHELDRLPPGQPRIEVLSFLHDQFAGRICHEVGAERFLSD